RNAVAGAEENGSGGVGGAVGCRIDREARLEGGIDEAVDHLPAQAAVASADCQVEPLAARAADIFEVAGVGRGRDELNVVAVDGPEGVRAPHQRLVADRATYAELGGALTDLRQIRITGAIASQTAGRTA